MCRQSIPSRPGEAPEALKQLADREACPPGYGGRRAAVPPARETRFVCHVSGGSAASRTAPFEFFHSFSVAGGSPVWPLVGRGARDPPAAHTGCLMECPPACPPVAPQERRRSLRGRVCGSVAEACDPPAAHTGCLMEGPGPPGPRQRTLPQMTPYAAWQIPLVFPVAVW